MKVIITESQLARLVNELFQSEGAKKNNHRFLRNITKETTPPSIAANNQEQKNIQRFFVKV